MKLRTFFVRRTLLFQAILAGMGLQHKVVEDVSTELELPSSQLLGLFNRTIRKCVSYLNQVVEDNVSLTLGTSSKEKRIVPTMNPTVQTLDEDLESVAQVIISVFLLF